MTGVLKGPLITALLRSKRRGIEVVLMLDSEG